MLPDLLLQIYMTMLWNGCSRRGDLCQHVSVINLNYLPQ